MFRCKATPYRTPRITKIRDWLYPFGVGALLLSMFGVALYRGHFPSRSSSNAFVITAADHPILYWAYLLFLCALGVFMLRIAFSHFKKWRTK